MYDIFVFGIGQNSEIYRRRVHRNVYASLETLVPVTEISVDIACVCVITGFEIELLVLFDGTS